MIFDRDIWNAGSPCHV